MIKKLLVANRGEIAVRIFRGARELGIKTVAVYSDADRHALHVRDADEAVHIGAPEPSASYLDIEKILGAARDTGADAIHPGYGFLSERAEFAEACRTAGIIFVGPSPEAMRRLGGKIDAKKVAVAAGVPITPGFFEQDATVAQMKSAADEIGYPIMLKASAGGGGRGMRIVRDPAAFEEELRIASDEALKGFGDGTMMVEKLVEQPRHVEVQLLADSHGNVAALFERECSIQRRHQKLIEEAPAPSCSEFPALWPAMREASIALAKAAGYVGAGTVEFMVDPKTGEFYFLEVNARLQVEHPVTELITGVDLVREQLRIASGLPLEVPQAVMEGDRHAIRGHAIEVRVVAEDPAQNFLPSIGPILGWAEPKGPGIRVDTGYGPHGEITRYYDSLAAKLIVHGQDRGHAIARLSKALRDFHILGIQTSINYVQDVIRHPEYVAGTVDTNWLARNFPEWKPSPEIPAEMAAILSAASAPAVVSSGSGPARLATVWNLGDGFRNARTGFSG
jgi:acetyl-CoA carboxylase, biotin carboxylase subunit